MHGDSKRATVTERRQAVSEIGAARRQRGLSGCGWVGCVALLFVMCAWFNVLQRISAVSLTVVGKSHSVLQLKCRMLCFAVMTLLRLRPPPLSCRRSVSQTTSTSFGFSAVGSSLAKPFSAKAEGCLASLVAATATVAIAAVPTLRCHSRATTRRYIKCAGRARGGASLGKVGTVAQGGAV